MIDLRIRFSLADTELTAGKPDHGAPRGQPHDWYRRSLGQRGAARDAAGDISAAPPTVTSSGNEYMTGLVLLREDLLILLDVDRLFGDEETQALAEAAVGVGR